MVPVRKPGRPLSSCPHPASRPCSCAAVTAAIPRKQTCHCGSPSKNGKSTNGKKSSQSSDAGDTSPSTEPKPPSSSFKIQKPPAKNSTSRSQSIDVNGLGRMDPTQLNILHPQNGVPKYSTTDLNGSMAAPGTLNPVGSCNGHVQSSNGTIQPLSTQFTPLQPSSSTMNGHPESLHGGQESSIRSSTSNGGGCCSGKKQGRSSPVTSNTTETSKNAEIKSCCSMKQESASPTGQPSLSNMPPTNGGAMGFNPTLAMQAGGSALFQQPSIYSYPPQYGSYMQPLQPEQWRQVMAAMMFAQPPPQHMFGMPAVPTMSIPGASTSGSDQDWTSHHCGCGESCQCVGCAAHPYNEATQNYVKSAWNTMLNETQKQQSITNGGNHIANERLGESNKTNGETNGSVQAPISGGDAAVSPVPPQTPSDATSGLADEQNLPANDFFFVSYPFSDGCEGDMGSCPCGDDCQCIGCAIHGNAPDSEATTQNNIMEP